MATTTSLRDSPVLVQVWTSNVTMAEEAEFTSLAAAADFAADQDPDGRGWPSLVIFLDTDDQDEFPSIAEAEAFIAEVEG